MRKAAATDEALLERVAAGDRAALGQIYRRHLDPVLAFVRRRVEEPEIAFDIAAETFAAVALGASSYDGRGPVAGWIYGIARNQVAMALRRQRVEDDARRRLGFEPITLTDADLERVEERAAAGSLGLDEALARLPAATREVLLARVVDEREYAEIAAQMQCSQQVVRQRVHRGLDALRTAMGEQE